MSVDYGQEAAAALGRAVAEGSADAVLSDATALYGVARPGIWAGPIEARLLELPTRDAQAIRRAARRVAGTRPVPQDPAPQQTDALPPLVVVGTTWWVRQRDGYLPVLRELGPEELERAGHDCTGLTAEGSERQQSPVEVYRRHGVTGREVLWTYDLERPVWDPVARRLAVCGARVTSGRVARSDAVHDWLTALCDQPDRLLDWLATADQLQRPTAAVQLSGPDSIGKAMLVAALGTWLGGTTTYDTAVSRFCAELARGPVVWLDEGVIEPAPDHFRRLTGNDRHPLEAKYRTGEWLQGCPRVVITSNEPDPLQLGHLDLSTESEHAIGRRILQLRGREAARRTREQTEGWVAPDGDLVAHLRWLARTRQVTPGPRFLVEGDGREWVATAHLRSGVGADVLAGYRTYLEEPDVRDRLSELSLEPYVHETDLVGVSVSHLAQSWRTLLGEHERIPSSRRLGEALRRLAGAGPEREATATGRGPRRYWVPRDRLGG